MHIGAGKFASYFTPPGFKKLNCNEYNNNNNSTSTKTERQLIIIVNSYEKRGVFLPKRAHGPNLTLKLRELGVSL